MKKIKIALIALLYVPVLLAQNEEVKQKTGKEIFPTKYAVILYGNEVTDTSGNNKMIASHWQNSGGATFTWTKDIKYDGDYEVAISYSINKIGTVAKISVDTNNIVAAVLQVTSGYYPEKKDWYQFNCERRQIPGILHLRKGPNNITLQLITKDLDDEAVLYAIELLPVNEKEAAEKDLARSQKIHPATNWFAKIPYGVMFHWTSQSTPETGALKPYNEAVNAFDVAAFVNMVVKTGAGYVIFTTNHAEPYFPAPLKEWEIVYPGHTTQRDLVEEIADNLEKHNIKLFLYMATHVYAKYDSVSDSEFQRLNYTLVREIGERYQKKVAGFWFDGWYQCYEKHPDFDFEKFYEICKAGNNDRLVSLNSWLYPIVTLWQDYWAGEVYTIGNPPDYQIIKNGPGTGLQTHNLIVMETEDWLHSSLNTKIPSPHLKADELINFISRSNGKGPVTINIQIYQDGKISDEALSVMKKVKTAIKN